MVPCHSIWRRSNSCQYVPSLQMPHYATGLVYHQSIRRRISSLSLSLLLPSRSRLRALLAWIVLHSTHAGEFIQPNYHPVRWASGPYPINPFGQYFAPSPQSFSLVKSFCNLSVIIIIQSSNNSVKYFCTN